jgi:HEAT repeat protein
LAEEAVDPGVLQVVVDLLHNENLDMRAVGYEQVRNKMPGEAATKAFADVLPQLPPESQTGLLEALADRGDPAARDAVLAALDSAEATVRAAATRALGSLGTSADVPVLARQATAESSLERDAARESLVRLRGEGIDAAIVAVLGEEEASGCAALLDVLARRGAAQAVPAVLEHARHSDATVRRAALAALRHLARDDDATSLVSLVVEAPEADERWQAELTLRALCARNREACVTAILESWKTGSSDARVALIRSLARAGGDAALDAIVAHLDDKGEAVRAEAVRMVAGWPDASAVPHVIRLAEKKDSLREQVLAVRGLVRLAGSLEDRAQGLQLLRKAIGCAPRPDEKRLALGALGETADVELLQLAASLRNEPGLQREADLAAVRIAERLPPRGLDVVTGILETIVRDSDDVRIRGRAKQALAGN